MNIIRTLHTERLMSNVSESKKKVNHDMTSCDQFSQYSVDGVSWVYPRRWATHVKQLGLQETAQSELWLLKWSVKLFSVLPIFITCFMNHSGNICPGSGSTGLGSLTNMISSAIISVWWRAGGRWDDVSTWAAESISSGRLSSMWYNIIFYLAVSPLFF